MTKKDSNIVQAGKFSVVGALNTAIDFTILNIFNSVVGLPRIPSNIISTSVAMIFSFLANRKFVFKSSGKNYIKQAVIFLAVTAFGLYVLQNAVIYLLTVIWTGPLELGYKFVGVLGLDSVFSKEFVFTNGSKIVATIFSLTWNFLMYKKYVYTDGKSK